MEKEIIYLNDLFWTFQGEGLLAGRRALFVRMPFCNLTCKWCDTEYNYFEKVSYDDFLKKALEEPTRFAVITGGEPLLHKHTPKVIKLLKDHGFKIACETNGTMGYLEGIDFVTCSPKRDADFKVHTGLYYKVDEYKFVVDDKFDFAVLDRFKDVPENVTMSLSPEYGEMMKNVNKITDYIKENPRWRLNLQTHKWIDIL